MKIKGVAGVAARRMFTGCGKRWNGVGRAQLTTHKSKNADQLIGAHGQETYYSLEAIIHEFAVL